MTKRSAALLALTVLLCAPARAQAQIDPENSSIVWVKPGNALDSMRSALVNKQILVTNSLENTSNMVVTGNAVEVQNEIAADPFLSERVDYVEPNGIVRLFPSECVPMAAPAGEPVPYGVKRVGGPIALNSPKRVWIVDSGISVDYDADALGELNVDRKLSVECDAQGCARGTADDSFGHGTAVASIIGAIQNERGLIGVAPGATLVPVKVFQSPEADWASIYSAMSYLMDNVVAGDVVNISFGGPWVPLVSARPRGIERQLHELADRGARLAVAAGTPDARPAPAYVETVSPARAGAYRSRDRGGAVMTVSAMDQDDKFWPESGFGNGEKASDAKGLHMGPPDVAEPGVAIPALWINREMRSCTGTSFAAPHLAGILTQGLPRHDGQVKGDIDMVFSSLAGDEKDPKRGDPIGVCVPGPDGRCAAN
jgi:subtilisin family serine protease